MSDIVHSLK